MHHSFKLVCIMSFWNSKCIINLNEYSKCVIHLNAYAYCSFWNSKCIIHLNEYALYSFVEIIQV